jgi:dihydrofolate reductase
MAKLNSFTFMSLNGFYKGMDEDIQWHQHGKEEAEYSVESLKTGNTLLFGRKTYEMMKSFWPTQMAFDTYPEVADLMNKAEKLVVSSSVTSADWNNTKIIHNNLVENIERLKLTHKNDITILGSGSLLRQLSEANLIDAYQIMIDPVFIATGQPILDNINRNINLKLKKSRVLNSGTILLFYEQKGK